MRIKIILLYVTALFFFSCGGKKRTFEKVVHKDSISYTLPFSSEISLNAICDTLDRNIVRVKSGPVRTEVRVIDGKPVLITQYDTIFKEKIKYVDRVKTQEVVRWRLDWRWIIAAAAGGLLLGLVGRKWLL